MKRKKHYLEYICFVVPILLALICIVFVSNSNHQATLPTPMPQEFVGEYSYDGENWQPLTETDEISALAGDLFLRGTFVREMKEGWQLNFYRNHIGIKIMVNGERIYEDSIYSITDLAPELFASMCAREWVYAVVPTIGTEDVIEINLHNPHTMGNKTAYRDFLTTLCSDPVEWHLLEQKLDSYGQPFRIQGVLFAVFSLMLLGAAAVALLLRIPEGTAFLKIGLMILFASGYMVFDSIDISYWSNLNILNTYASQLCMMLAVFCLASVVGDNLTGRRQQIAKFAVLLSALLNSVLITLSFIGVTAIYDTLPYWVVSQFILCPLFIILCGGEIFRKAEVQLIPASAIMLFVAILLDIAGVGATIVWRTPCIKITLSVLFVVYVVVIARRIVTDYRASIRADKLEKELEDSRIAIMLSQIKPHFLYNVLNTIYYLYRKEPETAQEAVNNFAEYLRCNMLSIEKSEPIPFTEEYQHIKTYLSLEEIRFGDKLHIVYDIETTNFKVPPLTIEPLVENAVKHGVTKKRGGGTVTISTRRTEESVQITVADTGVGFEPERYMEDGKQHVGIRNVRERLQSMVDGTLAITSSENGTIAVVTIPVKGGNRVK